VIFDPFGDFETRGYLRNAQRLKELAEVKALEHRHFLKNLDLAFGALSRLELITYEHVLDTHKTLFGGIYPWAGQDRAATAPDVAISRGKRGDLFAHPQDVRRATEFALRRGQDVPFMASHPGEVMGTLAYTHPFLDGNGRTIMVVHTELATRAGIRIDWAMTDKQDYLAALTRELDRPGKGELDMYLKSFVGPAVSRDAASAALGTMRGFGPEPTIPAGLRPLGPKE
jgi:cell filamentation protein